MYLIPQKKPEWSSGNFFHNRSLKLSYFHDFDGREHYFMYILDFIFVIYPLKMILQSRYWAQNDRNDETFPSGSWGMLWDL